MKKIYRLPSWTVNVTREWYRKIWNKCHRNWRIRWIDPITLIGKWAYEGPTIEVCCLRRCHHCRRQRCCLCVEICATGKIDVYVLKHLQFKSILFSCVTHLPVSTGILSFNSLWKFISLNNIELASSAGHQIPQKKIGSIIIKMCLISERKVKRKISKVTNWSNKFSFNFWDVVCCGFGDTKIVACVFLSWTRYIYIFPQLKWMSCRMSR